MASENTQARIKSEILQALRHQEAEEGLYFRNFFHLHEEDERPPVRGNKDEIMSALDQLIAEGQVTASPGSNEEKETIFSLSTQLAAH